MGDFTLLRSLLLTDLFNIFEQAFDGVLIVFDTRLAAGHVMGIDSFR
jgi:hypothetical protein